MTGEWDAEIETLSAIFSEEVEIVSEDCIKVKVINEESYISIATLVIMPLEKESYPSSRAIVKVEDLAISSENLLYITNKLQKLIDDNIGYSMIFDVIETLRGELKRISTFDSQGLFTFLAKETILGILKDCDLNSIWNLLRSSKMFLNYINEDMYKYFYNITTGHNYSHPPNLTWRESCQFIDFSNRHILQYAISFLERKGLPEPMPSKSNWVECLLKELQIADPRMSYECSRVYINEEKRYSIIFKTQKTADLETVAFQIGSVQFFSVEFANKKSLFPSISPKRDCQWSGQDTILGWCNVEFGPLYENSEGQQLLKNLLYYARGTLFKSKRKDIMASEVLNHFQYAYYRSLRESKLNSKLWVLVCDPLKLESVVFLVKYNQTKGKIISAQLSKKTKGSINFHLLSSFADNVDLNEVDQDNLAKNNSYLYTIVSNLVHHCKNNAPALKNSKNNSPTQIFSLEVSLDCWIVDAVIHDAKDTYNGFDMFFSG